MNAGLDLNSCWHCGQPSVKPIRVSLPDGEHPVCCHGCAAAARTIHGLGLGDYYRFRDGSLGVTPPEDAEAELVVFGMPELVAPFLQQRGDEREFELLVDGLHCAACVWLIEKAMKSLPGMSQVTLSLTSRRLRVTWRGPETTPRLIARRLLELGYRPRLPGTRDPGSGRDQRMLLARLLVAGLGAMQSMMYATALYIGAFDGIEPVWETFFRVASLLVATPVIFFSGWPFLQSAWRALRVPAVNMDVPIALALTLGWSGSIWAMATGGAHVYFESLAMFVFFLLLSRWLEQRQRQRVLDLFGNLQADMPLVVSRLEGDGESRISLRQVMPGDRLRLRQGDLVPVDGRVIDGQALVQEAALTGEPVPLQRSEGAPLMAGSRLQEGWLVLEAATRAADSRLARIGALVERAQDSRFLPWRGLQKVASGFVAAVLALAAFTLAWHWSAGPALAFEHALAVLVVTCPCALALAAPLTVAAMVGKGLEHEVLVADPGRILGLPEVRHVLLDKTGTLTHGDFVVDRMCALVPGATTQEFLPVVAGLESHASHPLAAPLAGLAAPEPVDGVTLTRRGVEGFARGHRWRITGAPVSDSTGTVVMLYRDDQPVLEIVLRDRMRDEAPTVLAALHGQRLSLHLASGDHAGAVTALAAGLPLESAQAGLSPEDKGARVHALQESGPVLVVGDGVNDAPAFLAADAAVAVAGSSALARDAASAYFLAEGLERLPWLFGLARRARATLYQNLAWAAGYNLVAVPFAIAGLVPPWLAAIGMSLSSLIVTGNAARLARWKS